MKKILLSVLAIAAVTFTAAGQEKIAPRTEYSVSVSENAIQVKPGESKEITLTLLRSKPFSKAKAQLGLSSALPAGVNVTFSPSEGMLETSQVTFTVAPDAKEGNYTIILKTTLTNKIKGTIVKLVVTSTPVAADAVTSN